MRDSFVFYKSFYESIKELELTDQVKIYNAIFEYEFYNNEVELNGISKSIFTLVLPQLEANNKRYENGKKGGRPKNQTETKTKPKQNQTETKVEPNVNVNVNVNDNKKKNIKKKKFGEFGRVLLTEAEYEKLITDFGENFIKEQIKLLDEYVESNDNKNKYKNFNLVLRKSINENWFNKTSKQSAGERTLKQLSKNGFQL